MIDFDRLRDFEWNDDGRFAHLSGYMQPRTQNNPAPSINRPSSGPARQPGQKPTATRQSAATAPTRYYTQNNAQPPQSNQWESYIDRYGDLGSAFSGLTSEQHRFIAQQGYETDAQGRVTKAGYGQFHYNTHGRGEGRMLADPTPAPRPAPRPVPQPLPPSNPSSPTPEPPRVPAPVPGPPRPEALPQPTVAAPGPVRPASPAVPRPLPSPVTPAVQPTPAQPTQTLPVQEVLPPDDPAVSQVVDPVVADPLPVAEPTAQPVAEPEDPRYVAPVDVPYYGYGEESVLHEEVPEYTPEERQQMAIADFQNSPESQLLLQDRFAPTQRTFEEFQATPEYRELTSQFAPTSQTFEADPGYEFRRQEGQRALDQSAASRGILLSGKQIKDAQRFGQDFASNEYSRWYQRAASEDAIRQNRFSTAYNNWYNRAGSEDTNNYNRTAAGYSNYVNRLMGVAGVGVTPTQTATNVSPYLNAGANAFGQMGAAQGQLGANLASVYGSNANAQGAIWGNALGGIDWNGVGKGVQNWFSGGSNNKTGAF